MKNTIVQALTDVTQNSKVGHTVGVTTTASGAAAHFLEVFANNIGLIASITGIILSSSLIILNWIRDKRDKEYHAKRMELIELQIVEANGNNGVDKYNENQHNN